MSRRSTALGFGLVEVVRRHGPVFRQAGRMVDGGLVGRALGAGPGQGEWDQGQQGDPGGQVIGPRGDPRPDGASPNGVGHGCWIMVWALRWRNTPGAAPFRLDPVSHAVLVVAKP